MAAKSDVISPIKPFVISRAFDAPRSLVWKAWTEPERIAKWLGPKGAILGVGKMDFRVGGTYHYNFRYAEMDMWGKVYYREITEPDRLVYVNTFSDEQGRVTRHPLSPTWPAELLTTVTFVEHDGKTTVTVEWIPINATESEIKIFDEGRNSMKQGWGGTFERLAEYLPKQ